MLSSGSPGGLQARPLAAMEGQGVKRLARLPPSRQTRSSLSTAACQAWMCWGARGARATILGLLSERGWGCSQLEMKLESAVCTRGSFTRHDAEREPETSL